MKTVTMPMDEFNELVESNLSNLEKIVILRKEIDAEKQEIEENVKKGLFCKTVDLIFSPFMEHHTMSTKYIWSDAAEEYKKLQEENISLKKKLAIERIDRDDYEFKINHLRGYNREIHEMWEENLNEIVKVSSMSVIEFLKWRKS